MGNCNFKADDSETCEKISRNHFQFHYPIGKGGFGKVWKVTHKKTKQTFALKEMLKTRIFAKRSVHSVNNERKHLAILRHPLIINIVCAFQDKENLYLVLEYKSGGDLRYHLGRQRRFSEEQTRFFVACLLLSLEYLHSNGIIHRDIKPENLVLDSAGYLYMTDFGIARIWQPENSNETSGTPGYMAPEILCRQNYTAVVDFFAIGVMVYEFMTGRRPYLGKDRKEVRDSILARQVQVPVQNNNDAWSLDGIDFCNRMLQRKPEERLGYEGVQQAKVHPWLAGFDWQGVLNKTVKAPFVPLQEENFDVRHVMDMWRDEMELGALKENCVDMFPGYFYDYQLNADVTSIDSVKNTK